MPSESQLGSHGRGSKRKSQPRPEEGPEIGHRAVGEQRLSEAFRVMHLKCWVCIEEKLPMLPVPPGSGVVSLVWPTQLASLGCLLVFFGKEVGQCKLSKVRLALRLDGKPTVLLEVVLVIQ